MDLQTKLLSLWHSLDGRKTLLGVLIGVVYGGLLHMGLIEQMPLVEAVVLAVLGVGIGHKVRKG